MMRRCFVILLAVAAALVIAPEVGSAQGRGKGPAWAAGGPPPGRWGQDQDARRAPRERNDRWGRDRDRRDRDWDWGRDRDGRWDRRARVRGNGPAFCRSGAGHPVHGRRWCLEKGFGLGNRSLVDIIFRAQRDERRRYRRSDVSAIDILEDVLDARRRLERR